MIEDRIDFIQWLINRLIYKHRYANDDVVIVSLLDIKKILSEPQKIDITDESLDKIIVKYYSDFYLDKCDDWNVGFTEKERILLRQTLRNIVKDILQTIK